MPKRMGCGESSAKRNFIAVKAYVKKEKKDLKSATKFT